MAKSGNLIITGEEADQYIDMQPGQERMFNVRARFVGSHVDEFGRVNIIFKLDQVVDTFPGDGVAHQFLTEMRNT